MAAYYVNNRAQDNGDHEVHRVGCRYLPAPENRTYLGRFDDCFAALREAKKYFDRTDGCYYCSRACHSS